VSGDGLPLVICSKSSWHPSIRREHAMAELAAAHGHPVLFVERPRDVRALTRPDEARAWWRGLRGTTRHEHTRPGVRVMAQATVLPGHLNGASELTSTALLRRGLRRVERRGSVVVNVPWQWPASASLAARRVFDCADDWSALMPHRTARLEELYARIGREADAIVLANSSLASSFPSERTLVVRNGVAEEMLAPLIPPAGGSRLIHTGTLTPRFDAELAAAVLDRLPEDWTLELYGQCQYPGARDRPDAELARLLADHAPRVSWHGVIPRESLAGAIDAAAVALVLNRPERSCGQDSMKLYDYAARGRPIVTTRFSPSLEQDGPPHLCVVDDPAAMAEAILAARREPDGWARDRRAWAERQRWESRWPAWSAALFGGAA